MIFTFIGSILLIGGNMNWYFRFIIGDKWGFQYEEEAFLPQIDYYHLTEISLDELEKNPQLLDYDE